MQFLYKFLVFALFVATIQAQVNINEQEVPVTTPKPVVVPVTTPAPPPTTKVTESTPSSLNEDMTPTKPSTSVDSTSIKVTESTHSSLNEDMTPTKPSTSVDSTSIKVTKSTEPTPIDDTTLTEDTTDVTPSYTITTEDPGFHCVGVGFYAKDSSCTDFYYCMRVDKVYHPYEMKCPKGQNYMAGLNYCSSTYECSEQ